MISNRTAGAALAVVISGLSARILMPAELGSMVAAVASVALLMRMASFGLGQSAQFYGARESTESLSFGRALFVASIPVTVFSFSVLLFSGHLIGSLVLAGDPAAQELFGVLQYGIPLGFIHFVAALYLLGRRDMRRYFWMSILPVLSSVFVLGWAALGNRGTHAVMSAWMAQYVLSFLLGIFAFVGRSKLPSAALGPALTAMYRYGRKSYFVSITSFAGGRIGLIMGPWFTTSAEVGFFAVGRTFAEALLLVYGAIGPLIFSYVGSMDDPNDCHKFIGRVCRISFLFFTALSVAIAAAAPIGIGLIFGSQYSHSHFVVWALLPGLVFSALQRILENYLYGRAKHKALAIVNGVSLALLVGFGVLFAPRFGALGLAFASTISFVGAFVFTAITAFRVDGLSPMGIVLPTKSDFVFLMENYRRWASGLRNRTCLFFLGAGEFK